MKDPKVNNRTGFSEKSRGCWNFKGARHAHDVNVRKLGAAAPQTVQRSLQQPLGDERVPAAYYDAEAHATRVELALCCFWR